MKIVTQRIPNKIIEDKAAMDAMAAWAGDRGGDSTGEFGGMKVTKTYRGQTVFIEPAEGGDSAQQQEQAGSQQPQQQHAGPKVDPQARQAQIQPSPARQMNSPQRQAPTDPAKG